MYNKQLKAAIAFVSRGHEFFDKKEYEEAIEWYRKGINEFELILSEIKLLKYGKNYLKAIDFYQGIWGWLGKAYREVGEEKKAINCFNERKKYQELQELYAQRYLEKFEEKKKQKRQDFHYFLIIGLIYAIMLCIGMISSYLLISLIPLNHLFIFPVYFIIYIIILMRIRRQFEVREQYIDKINILARLWNYFRNLSDTDRRLIENFTKNAGIFIYLVILTFLMVPWWVEESPRIDFVFIFHILLILLSYILLIADFGRFSGHWAYRRMQCEII